MSIPFTRWPEEFARRYREKGYWQDLPLTDILTRHADSDHTAVTLRVTASRLSTASDS